MATAEQVTSLACLGEDIVCLVSCHPKSLIFDPPSLERRTDHVDRSDRRNRSLQLVGSRVDTGQLWKLLSQIQPHVREGAATRIISFLVMVLIGFDLKR